MSGSRQFKVSGIGDASTSRQPLLTTVMETWSKRSKSCGILFLSMKLEPETRKPSPQPGLERLTSELDFLQNRLS